MGNDMDKLSTRPRRAREPGDAVLLGTGRHLIAADCRTVARIHRPGRRRPLIANVCVALPGEVVELIGAGTTGIVL